MVLLLAAVFFAFDPIVSLEPSGHLSTGVSCAGECRVITASLQFVDGSFAASAHGDRCGDDVLLQRVPFGARLVPVVTFSCNGTVRSETGPAVTIAPYLTNVSIEGRTVWVPAMAAPHGDERVRLRVSAEGFEQVEEFGPRSELVMRDAGVPYGTVTVRATLEPYGVASNTRVVHREEPSAHFNVTGVGCASTPLVLPLLLFPRRRFPFPRRFC